MKRLLATAATALVLGTSAYADTHTAAFSDMKFDAALNLNASELIGKRVYATEDDVENKTTIAADGEAQWDHIGEINEIILTRDGNVQSVIVGVGGFLGVGERDVAIDMSQFKFVTPEGQGDDYFLVVNASADGVKEAPEYVRDDNAEVQMKNNETSAAETNETGMAETESAVTPMASSENRPMLAASSIERAGYSTAMVDDLTAEDLTGARVYGINDEDIGEIGELLLTDDGKMDRAVIDVGGFLGIGERPVAVTFDELQIVRADDGGAVRVYIDSSEEALEQQPE